MVSFARKLYAVYNLALSSGSLDRLQIYTLTVENWGSLGTRLILPPNKRSYIVDLGCFCLALQLHDCDTICCECYIISPVQLAKSSS